MDIPKKKSSSESKVLFPYLKLSDLDEDGKYDLEERLIDDTKQIIVDFASFTFKVRKSLEDHNIPLDDLKDFVLSLRPFVADIAVKLLDEMDEKKIENATSIVQVFITLRKYISFFNYEIIEKIIEWSGLVEDQERLQEYIRAFNYFCERNIFEIPVNVLSADRSTAKKIVFKCIENGSSLEGVQSMKRKIAKAVGLKPLSLQLCSIKEGCIELHFLISADVANRIFPVSPAQESALSDIGVRVLFCEEVEQEESRYIVAYHIVTWLFTHCSAHMECIHYILYM